MVIFTSVVYTTLHRVHVQWRKFLPVLLSTDDPPVASILFLPTVRHEAGADAARDENAERENQESETRAAGYHDDEHLIIV